MRIWTHAEATAAMRRVRALVESARAVAQGVGGSVNGDRQARQRRLQVALEALEREGVIVRDLARGLVDFPARTAGGRTYLLCWLIDEPEIAWWHWPEDGFAGRQPLTAPPS
jgi:hypothetical protein